MDPVVHFEMPYDDSERMARFYKGVFGWKIKSLDEKMNNYVLAGTSKSSPDGTPVEPGRINGGFFPRSTDMPSHPAVVIAVKDIRKAMARVNEAGGKVFGEPMDIPGIGPYVAFADTEGNRASLLQPLPMEKPKKKAAPAKGKTKAKKKRVR
jgi:predicted enzyme related to lactoylglutathione lyase